MSEEIKEIPLKERIEKLLESGWVNEFNYLESQLQEARCLVVILQQKVEQLENIRKEAIKLIEEDILGKKIENVNWDYDECYYSDMPVERIKPLLNMLSKGE